MPEKRRKNKNKRKNKNNSYQNSNKSNVCIKEQCCEVKNDINQEEQLPKLETDVISSVCKIDELSVDACKNVLSESGSSLTNDLVVFNNSSILCSILHDGESSKTDMNVQELDETLNLSETSKYTVESPTKHKKKIKNETKSKSLDNEEAPNITEITDTLNQEQSDSLEFVDCSNVIISEVESEVEWETTHALNEKTKKFVDVPALGSLSIACIPLGTAQCDEVKSLTPEEELSLREYLKTLNLSTHLPYSLEMKTEIQEIIDKEIRCKLRKKGISEECVSFRLGPQRFLDVIDEEGSSESSIASRRHSYNNNDKKSELNQNESKDIVITKGNNTSKDLILQQIPQTCFLVDAKVKEQDITEARVDWSKKTWEKIKGVEVVYLTDSSSSTSSLYEEESIDEGDKEINVRMVTPVIEIVDTDKLLNKSFTDCEPTINKCDNKSSTNNDGINKESENPHEIVVLSTDNLKTSLYVKDLNEANEKIIYHQEPNELVVIKSNKDQEHNYADEIKTLKSELNEALNTLIKEVSDSESEKCNLTRQDSSSSIGSSQCTAKYNPTQSSLNDVSNILHDEIENNKIDNEYMDITESHVKDIFDCVSGTSHQNIKNFGTNKVIQPNPLKDLCLQRIKTLPYGEKVIEELAAVSERIQYMTNSKPKKSIISSKDKSSSFLHKLKEQVNDMPYFPLPDIASIEKVSLPTTNKKPLPPPVLPRRSSLRKSQDDSHWTGLPTQQEPVYMCLSPSQKMLMEKTNTVLTKEDATNLVDMHSKFVDRRGYNEIYNKSNKRDTNVPAVPFKSQTGSRLLAIIRDPAVTNNIKSAFKYQHNNSATQTYTNQFSESKTDSKHDLNSALTLKKNLTKPVPPPRPRKFSSSFYESDESSDFTDNSMRSIKSERKIFHYSTGNLNKDIENDISSIQNMHRRYTNVKENAYDVNSPRRPSLPKDICEQQMEYIRQKEKEVEAEIQRLEQLKSNLGYTEKKQIKTPHTEKNDVTFENNSKFENEDLLGQKDLTINKSSEKITNSKLMSNFSSSQEEIQRDKMYTEYMSQMAQRQERKQQKVIKITNATTKSQNCSISKSMTSLDILNAKTNNPIEKEFICKARERWNKLGIKDPETEDEREEKDVYKEPKVIEHKIKVIECGEVKDVGKLPNHLQDFVRITAKEKNTDSPAVWRPGAPSPTAASAQTAGSPAPPPPPPPPIWIPGSAGTSPRTPRKNFRPVHFEESPPVRRKVENSAHQNGYGSDNESKLRTSLSAPASGLSSLGTPSSPATRLPRAQNPTVTLLQKARESNLQRSGSNYLQQERDAARLPNDRASPPRGHPVHALRREYASEGEAERAEERASARKMESHRKVDGIGPTTKDGMPVTLRSEVKDPSKWYKKMYDTIHKNKYDGDYVTIRYKSPRGQSPQRASNKSQYAYFDPRSGYLSEPEGGLSRLSNYNSDAYDSDVTSRRRTASVQDDRRNDNDVTSPYLPSNKYSTLASARASQEVYKNQPGRIENYVPGKSSVVEKEAKQWWDEVMDIFDGHLSSTTSLPQASPKEKKDVTSTILSKSNMARALKESGYESDSTLVFRRRDDIDGGPLSPSERRAAYKDLQAGGEPPLRGFRSPAPQRQESPRRYVESDVNIHYRCPVRRDPLPLVPERELARQQAEHMKKLYREQKRAKYLQDLEIDPMDIEAFDASIKELQDMQSRRHQDNFMPSQKTVVPLNRYDEAERTVARALYTFNGHTSRELSFKKGDLVNVRRQIDSNWYEGDLHGKIGLFPYNYVEILKGDAAVSPLKTSITEGRARAKFDFTAQTNLELPLKKGEVVVLTRRIDQNWWEGKNGNKTGIFPDSYVQVIQEPRQSKPEVAVTEKPLASPASHGQLTSSARHSMGAHSYTPQLNSPALSNAPQPTQPLTGYSTKPAAKLLTPSERGYGPPTTPGVDLNNTEPLYVDTNAEAIPYRAMYKYRPQNPDELELNEGDTVYVLEKCDDGWYVGSSQRTGRFGTFPGNYVERI